jgi:hypothetical protein
LSHIQLSGSTISNIADAPFALVQDLIPNRIVALQSRIRPPDILIEIAPITARGLTGQPVKCSGERARFAEADILFPRNISLLVGVGNYPKSRCSAVLFASRNLGTSSLGNRDRPTTFLIAIPRHSSRRPFVLNR